MTTRKSEPHRYVAFLRGINVGGNVLIKMTDLQRAFQEVGFTNVKTVLASGNVVFESDQKDPAAVSQKITAKLKTLMGRDIGLILRTREELQKLHALEPFKHIEVTPTIRLYVSFLKSRVKEHGTPIPYVSPDEGFSVIGATGTEIFMVTDVSKSKGTPAAMSALEKQHGTGITTRNWNTIEKILKK